MVEREWVQRFGRTNRSGHRYLLLLKAGVLREWTHFLPRRNGNCDLPRGIGEKKFWKMLIAQRRGATTVWLREATSKPPPTTNRRKLPSRWGLRNHPKWSFQACLSRRSLGRSFGAE